MRWVCSDSGGVQTGFEHVAGLGIGGFGDGGGGGHAMHMPPGKHGLHRADYKDR